MDGIILILKKYIGFQKYIPVSDLIVKISILKKSIDFQQYIPVSDDNTYCLTKRFVKYIYMVSL